MSFESSQDRRRQEQEANTVSYESFIENGGDPEVWRQANTISLGLDPISSLATLDRTVGVPTLDTADTSGGTLTDSLTLKAQQIRSVITDKQKEITEAIKTLMS